MIWRTRDGEHPITARRYVEHEDDVLLAKRQLTWVPEQVERAMRLNQSKVA